jgi:hypothetical protein
MIAGAAGGGALAHKISKGHPIATIAGAALGGTAGRHIGGELGTETDIARHKSASAYKTAAAHMVAWIKQADDAVAGMPEAEAPMASPTDNAELAPVNYMNAEMMGQKAQNKVEAAFYRQKVQAAQQQAQQATQDAQQQVQAIQQQSAQAMADAAQADTKVKAALDEAVKARDEALQQTETAAQMRMATQNLRMQLMQLASTDPTEQAALSLAATTGGAAAAMAPGEAQVPDAGLAGGPPNPPAAGDSGGGPPGGPAGAAPDLQTAPGAAPPAGSPDMNANAGASGPDPSMADPTSQLSNKTGAARRMAKTAGPIGGSIGAGVGAIHGAVKTRLGIKAGLAPVEARIAELQGAQDGSYGQAAALANARSLHAQRGLAIAYPARVTAGNALQGAINGMTLGNGAENLVRGMPGVIDKFRGKK